MIRQLNSATTPVFRRCFIYDLHNKMITSLYMHTFFLFFIKYNFLFRKTRNIQYLIYVEHSSIIVPVAVQPEIYLYLSHPGRD